MYFIYFYRKIIDCSFINCSYEISIYWSVSSKQIKVLIETLLNGSLLNGITYN